ncbi:hypothetical protein [Olleya sp. AS48]|uniref:hypothetical protein n=1 Tax=Olleya sp. AS48 TaxID=3135774 RepID=UPI0031704CFB
MDEFSEFEKITKAFIDDFLFTKSNVPYNIHHINWWLMKYEDEFYNAITKSNCGKWSKWIRDNSIHVFPCVCQTREQDCIFIELYFELLKVSELELKEVYFRGVMNEYDCIKNEKFALKQWLKKHKNMWVNLRLSKTIRIKLTTEPYSKLEVNLNGNDFRNFISFQKIYNRLHYAKEN